MLHITDVLDPRLADYASLKDDALRADGAVERRGAFITEGMEMLRHLAASRFPVRSVLCFDGRERILAEVLATVHDETPVFVGPREMLKALVGFDFHRGVLASGQRMESPPLESLLAPSRCAVVLEDLSNADNVGGVFRNVAALAGEGACVLLSRGCCDPLYRKAVRVSMGLALRVPFARLDPWADGLTALRRHGFTLVALTPGAEATDINTLSTGSVAKPALLLGAEGAGLSDAALSASDLRIRIPMAPGVDSLNVSVACAVSLSRLVSLRSGPTAALPTA